jgi:hypothetical protein
MRRRTKRLTWLLLAVCCLLLAAVSLALAQAEGDPTGSSQSGLDLSWWTVDGGGGTSSGDGGLRLVGTAGQPDAGLLKGDGFTLRGGLWRGGEAVGTAYKVYLPIVVR